MILPWLLHHANRADKYGTTREAFYKIKDRLLKDATTIGSDIQFIEGKICWTCNGSGVWVGWYSSDTCNHCRGTGFYHQNQWIELSKVQYGPYIFHRPLSRFRCKKNPFPIGTRIAIEGYVNHSATKHSKRALTILFLLFDFRGYWTRWWHQDWWFRTYWYYPSNWVYTFIHIIKHGRKSQPYRYLKEIHDQNVYEQENPNPF